MPKEVIQFGRVSDQRILFCKLIQSLWRTVWRFLKKLKIELPYDPAIPLLGIYLEKIIIQKDTCGLPWWRSG